MSTCVSCGMYYRINAFHTDIYDCQDCIDVILKQQDQEYYYFTDLLNPTGKVQAVYNEEDINDQE